MAQNHTELWEIRYAQIISGFLLMLMIPATVSAVDGSFSAGFEWGFISAKYKQDTLLGANTEIEERYNAPGINITGFVYFTPVFGIYANTSILFLSKTGFKTGDFEFKEQTVKPTIGFIGLIGPAFRWQFSEKLALHGAIGFSFVVGKAEIENYMPPIGYITVQLQSESTSFGLGTDVGIHFKLTPRFFMATGTKAELHFAGTRYAEYELVGVKQIQDGDLSDYSQFVFSPYINVGLAF